MACVTDQTNLMLADSSRHDYSKISQTLNLLTDHVALKASKKEVSTLREILSSQGNLADLRAEFAVKVDELRMQLRLGLTRKINYEDFSQVIEAKVDSKMFQLDAMKKQINDLQDDMKKSNMSTESSH